jgi:hypothetical protein
MANSFCAQNLMTQVERNQRRLGLEDGMREDEMRRFGVTLLALAFIATRILSCAYIYLYHC